MTQTRMGYLFGVGAYLCWGLFPLYWKLLRPATAMEILAHRIVWSFIGGRAGDDPARLAEGHRPACADRPRWAW